MTIPRRSPFLMCFAASLSVLALGSGSRTDAGQLASKPADEWIKRLERPERIASLQVDGIVTAIGLKPGMVVADLGAGPGVFSLPLAKAVSPGGKVYAVEVDQGFIDHINTKLKSQNVTNVQPVLGKFTDPNLPAKDVDLAFFHDVLHHIEKRPEYLKSLAAYLKPTSRIVVIDLDATKGSHRDDPSLQVRREELDRWMADLGFKPVQTIDPAVFRDDRWGVIYGKNAP